MKAPHSPALSAKTPLLYSGTSRGWSIFTFQWNPVSSPNECENINPAKSGKLFLKIPRNLLVKIQRASVIVEPMGGACDVS